MTAVPDSEEGRPVPLPVTPPPVPPLQLTPTQVRIMKVLRDRKGHAATELMACLNDDLTVAGTLHWHIFALRKKLIGSGQEIVWERTASGHYYKLRKSP